MTAKSETASYVLSYPDVADGNPATVFALEQSARECGVQTETVALTASSLPVNLFHGKISHDPEAAVAYSEHSEQRRLDARSRLYGKLAFAEFCARTGWRDVPRPARWIAAQEHQVLGASPRILHRLGITEIDLVVPDVFPKESAVEAVQRHDNAELVVWNTTAHDELSQRNVPNRLVAPFLLSGYRPDFPDGWGGDEIVVKASGSGMPEAWQQALVRELTQMQDTEWSVHVPGWQYDFVRNRAMPDKRLRLAHFFDRLGTHTRIIVGHPTELIEVVASAQAQGAPTTLLALPPRGQHEIRNMEFARDMGLLIGELSFSTSQRPTLGGVALIDVRGVGEVVNETPQVSHVSGLLGLDPYWQSTVTHQAAS